MEVTRPVEDPTYRVTYVNRNVTHSLSPLLTSLQYTDYEHGESDSLELELEDSRHLFKGEWFPDLTARLQASIGYTDGRLLDCGAFDLDEVEFSSNHDQGDRVRIKALATCITPALRTAQSVGYEGMTLREIVAAVALRNGLTVRGAIDPIAIDYTAQNHITDLKWLVQIAEDHGYACGVRGPYLDFWKVTDLEARPPVIAFQRHQLQDFTFRLKTEATYPEGDIQYHDPDTRGVILGRATQVNVPTGDRIKYVRRAKTQALADHKAQSQLHRVDKVQLNGTLIMVGNPQLAAGINIDLRGNRRLDGIYHVTQSTHRQSRQLGYETEIEVYRVSGEALDGGSDWLSQIQPITRDRWVLP